MTRFKPKGEWVNCGCRSIDCPHGTPYWREAKRGDGRRALVELHGAFSRAMLDRLSEKAATRGGWADDEFTIDEIKRRLVAAIEKGNPIDVANFAAFWWNKTGGDK